MLILLIVLMATTNATVLAAQIRKDGYGSHPGPRSHYDSLDPRSLAH